MGITAPLTDGFLSGLGTAFGTGLPHRLAKGALLQDVTALHFDLTASKPSVSTHIAALRNLLFGHIKGELAVRLKEVIDVCNWNLKILQVTPKLSREKYHLSFMSTAPTLWRP